MNPLSRRALLFATVIIALNSWAADPKPDAKLEGKAAEAKAGLQKQIVGAWQIIADANGNPPEDGFDGQIKFIGDKHWTALRPDPATKKLTFVLGGTYTLKGDEYVETIEFANEEAAGMIGQKVTFKLKIEGENLTQTGVGNPYTQTFKRAK